MESAPQPDNGREKAGGLPFENLEVRHERNEVNIGVIVRFGVWLVVAGIVINFIAWGLFHYFSNREDRLEPPPPPLVSSPSDRLPPDPRLQGAPGSKFPLQNPVLEMEAYKKAEEDLLDSYGWADKQAGRVRIPIERAKQILLQRGLPSRVVETTSLPAGDPKAAGEQERIRQGAGAKPNEGSAK